MALLTRNIIYPYISASQVLHTININYIPCCIRAYSLPEFLEPLRRDVRAFVGTQVVSVLSREAVIGWLFEWEENRELVQF